MPRPAGLHLNAETRGEIKAYLSMGMKPQKIADTVDCNVASVRLIKRNLRLYKSTSTPGHNRGRPPKLTDGIQKDLFDWLARYPESSLQDCKGHIWVVWNVDVSREAVAALLKKGNWSFNPAGRVSSARNNDLRERGIWTQPDDSSIDPQLSRSELHG